MITNTNCEPVVNNENRVELNLTLKHCLKHDNNTEEKMRTLKTWDHIRNLIPYSCLKIPYNAAIHHTINMAPLWYEHGRIKAHLNTFLYIYLHSFGLFCRTINTSVTRKRETTRQTLVCLIIGYCLSVMNSVCVCVQMFPLALIRHV